MPLIRKDPAGPSAKPAAPAADLLTRGAVDERWSAARAVGDEPGAVERLALALASEAEPRVREAILTNLVRRDTDAAVMAIAPEIRSDDAARRSAALDALRAMPLRLPQRLPELLSDPDPDVRLLSVDLARGLNAADATSLILGLLDRETEVNVCAAAIDALAETGDERALPGLSKCASRFPDEAFLQFAIRAAAGRLAASASD